MLAASVLSKYPTFSDFKVAIVRNPWLAKTLGRTSALSVDVPPLSPPNRARLKRERGLSLITPLVYKRPNCFPVSRNELTFSQGNGAKTRGRKRPRHEFRQALMTVKSMEKNRC